MIHGINGFCIEPLPKKREGRARIASRVIFAATALIGFVFCFLDTAVEYQKSETTTHINQTLTCYKRMEKEYYPTIVTTLLSFLGIIVGTLVERLSLIFEERHHVNERYDKDCIKMVKACFKGIMWQVLAVFTGFTLIMLVAYVLSTGIPVKGTTIFFYIVGSIGVGPFIISMLNMNTQSEVNISTIMEKNGTDVGSVLAWYYYFNYLEEALEKFTELTSDNNERLFENKLILLVSHDFHTEDNLHNIDRNFEKVREIEFFTVYKLNVNKYENRGQYAVQFAKEPLRALKQMKEKNIIRKFKAKQYEDEVKLFCRTIFQIIRENKIFREKCVLIPFKVGSLGRLNNGGLVRLVLHAIERTPSQPDNTLANQDSGFWNIASG